MAASTGTRFSEELPAQAEQDRNRQYIVPDNHRSALITTFNVGGEAIDRIIITENSDFARQHGENVLAVTRVNAIYLGGSGASFLTDLKLILHEYYHVLRQWNTGELTTFRYIVEWARQGFNYNQIKL